MINIKNAENLMAVYIDIFTQTKIINYMKENMYKPELI